METALLVQGDFIRVPNPGIEVIFLHFFKSINSRVFKLVWASGMPAMTDCAPVGQSP